MRGTGDNVKEKINLLAKGIFEYENPEIVMSEERLDFKVETGKIYEGKFEINSINHLEIRTKVFSSNKLMKVKSNDYVGESIGVDFTFDAQLLEAGEIIEGHFSIISNGGELEIPFKAEVCQPFCHTSMGPIKDLSQFTNLAQSNWHEALKIFRTSNFPRVFLVNKKYAHIYEMLIHGRNLNQAMEEFLCTIKRKRPVDIHIAQDFIEYENITEITGERLVIEKDNWGYQKIFVSTVGDFLHIYKKELTTEDFLGSYYELEYTIDPAFFKYGNNYGKIIVETAYRKIEIDVSCLKKENRQNINGRKTIHESVQSITQNYIDLQLGKIEQGDWVRHTREAIDCCRNRSQEAVYALYEAHFLLKMEQYVTAGDILKGINGRELRHKSVVQYCYYLYLNSLCRQDDSYTRFAQDKIDGYYDGRYDLWEILWMKLTMTGKISPGKKYQLIKKQFTKGCTSPLLYLEAVAALKEDLSLLREFDHFEVQLMNWAMKTQCMTEAVACRFADVASSGRMYSPLALKILTQCSQEYDSKRILPGICALLIRGNICDQEYNIWYRKGIENSLKQQGLYENYMYSLDEDKEKELPQGVLIYFNYDNQLTKEKKAFLYSYIVSIKDENPKIYMDYENIMKAFTHEQLGKGYISKYMAVLYRHFITKDRMTVKIASLLPNVLFKQEIKVDNPWIHSVIVAHRDVEKTTTYPIKDGCAYVDIYMEEYKLIFVDKMDNRYVGTIEYNIQPMLDSSEFVRLCASMATEHPMILLNRSERAIKYQKNDEASIDFYKRTLKLPYVSQQFRKNILKSLIDFYYDNYEGETLEKYLLQLDISILDSEERGGIIEYYIQRGLYDIAFKAIKDYGYDNIQDKKIMRLCSRKIKENHFEEDGLLRELAYYTFINGKYDDCILEYLIQHYMGTTKDLYAIWVAARNFEVDTNQLEEKILCQMLFAESFIVNDFAVFENYYKLRPEPKIVKAFLAYYSNKYLVRQKEVPTGLFAYLEMEYDQMNGATDVCCLALLKYYANTPDAMKDHQQWIVSIVDKYIERGMVLPFFKKFAKFPQLPGEILDKTYVSYYANPKHKVTIYYIIEEDDTNKENAYVDEEMHNVFGGIFVKTFSLFDDERLKYYIKENSEFSHVVTDGTVIEGGQDKGADLGSGKDLINRMIALAKEGSMEQLKDELQKYEEKRYLAKKMFSLIQ